MQQCSEEKLEKVLADFPHIWKNKTAWMTWLRGCLRKSWSTNPVKLELIKEKRYQIPNPNPRGNKPTVWGCKCEMCGEEDVLKNFQVDHVNSAGKLNTVSDVQGFVERLLLVGKDDLRMVCKGCNSALALADKQGISYDEAVKRKKVIAFGKESLDSQTITLYNLGIESVAKTKAGRVKQYSEVLNKEIEDVSNRGRCKIRENRK